MKKLVIVIMTTLLLVACGDDESSYATVKGAKIVEKTTERGYRSTYNYVLIEVNGAQYKLQMYDQDFNFVQKDTIVDITYDVGNKKITKIMIPSGKEETK